MVTKKLKKIKCERCKKIIHTVSPVRKFCFECNQELRRERIRRRYIKRKMTKIKNL